MRDSLVLTFIGRDRTGLVDRLAEVVATHGANWEESRMARLSGRFAGLLHLTVDTNKRAALEDALGGLESEGLRVLTEGAADRGSHLGVRVLHLELLGQDHEGIISQVSHALVAAGVNVLQLSTERESAPMAGGFLFRVRAELGVPAAVNLEDLRTGLERIGNELMVDITLKEEG